MKSDLPLLAMRDLAAPIAWCGGVPVAAATFIAEAQALADQLPPTGSPVNLCQDRYLFALGMAAALLRGQTSLMPPNVLPETLSQLSSVARDPYALIDEDSLDGGGLPTVRVERFVGLGPATRMPLIPGTLDAVCLLTSGSTGPPQPHLKRWGALTTNIRAEAERLAELMGRPSVAGLNLLATVPAQHSYGFESSVLLALLGGAAFDAGRPFYPADIAAALHRLPQPRALVTTPFHLKTLLLAGVGLPQVDLLLSATAPLSPQLAAEAETRCAGRLVEIYGCTEAGQVAARRTTDGDTWTVLGDLRMWSEDSAEGDPRYMVAGGHVEEATPLADMLELIDERRFRLLGRANDLIHVAGKRSSLAHLNYHLNRIEGVKDGAFWLPDEVAEAVTRPVAFVVAPKLSAQQITLALRQTIETAFVPRRVIHVVALPREPTGKLTASALRRFAQHTLASPDHRALLIAADHPALAGHFPGNPILPGVALLSLAMEELTRLPELRERIGERPVFEHVKFFVPVGPGARVHVTWREHRTGLAFELCMQNKVIANGVLSADPSP